MDKYHPITQPLDCLAVNLYHCDGQDKWKKTYALPIFFYDIVKTHQFALKTALRLGKYTVKHLSCGRFFQKASAKSIYRKAVKTYYSFQSIFYSPITCLYSPEKALNFHLNRRLYLPHLIDQAQKKYQERFHAVNRLCQQMHEIGQQEKGQSLKKKIMNYEDFRKKLEKVHALLEETKTFFELYPKLQSIDRYKDCLASIQSLQQITDDKLRQWNKAIRQIEIEVTRIQLRRETISQFFSKESQEEKLLKWKEELSKGEAELLRFKDEVDFELFQPDLIASIDERISQLQTPSKEDAGHETKDISQKNQSNSDTWWSLLGY